jgi:DNA-binding transcriptional ArsR family regulator
MNGYETSASILKALSHPVRLQILAVLRDAGLVTDRRDGMNVFYRLTDAAVEPLLDAAMAAAESASNQTLDFSLPDGPPCPCPRCELIHPQMTEQGEQTYADR